MRADETADDVVATSMALAVTIGKVATLVGVCPGFVGNHIGGAPREAQNLVNHGVLPWDVDNAFNAFGFKMGRFKCRIWRGWILAGKRRRDRQSDSATAYCEMDRRGQKPALAIMIMMTTASATQAR